MTITRNIVGLARFLFIIFSPRISRAKKPFAKELLLAKHIGPNITLEDKQPVFCSKCHVLICWTGKDNGETVVIDRNNNITRIGDITIKDKHGEKYGLPIICPNGHKEVIK